MDGMEKLLLHLGGKSLLELIVARVAPQVDAIAINVRDSLRDQYDTRVARETAIVFDPFAGRCGPLGGVVAGLAWLSGLGPEFEWLATFPGDTPFLPRNLVSELKASLQAGSSRPVVAFSQERIQSLCALWPKSLLRELSQGVQDGRLRSVSAALDEFESIRVPIGPADAFLNLNTKRDLAEAERLVEKRPELLCVNGTA